MYKTKILILILMVSVLAAVLLASCTGSPAPTMLERPLSELNSQPQMAQTVVVGASGGSNDMFTQMWVSVLATLIGNVIFLAIVAAVFRDK